MTEVTLDSLVAAGATKLRMNGNSCVAMHRSQIAGKAETILAEHPELTTVLWLDGDMVATVETVAELGRLTNQIAESRPLPDELAEQYELDKPQGEQTARLWRRTMGPAISGAYVKRNAPKEFALAACVPHEPPLTIDRPRGDGELERLELPAIVSGMGCLCQTREAFLSHVAEAPVMAPNTSRQFPAVCASGPGRAADGAVAWGSEDWTFCSWEWQRGRGVYLARHCPFGHIGESVFWPDSTTLFVD
jgi:hypothetical protein